MRVFGLEQFSIEIPSPFSDVTYYLGPPVDESELGRFRKSAIQFHVMFEAEV